MWHQLNFILTTINLLKSSIGNTKFAIMKKITAVACILFCSLTLVANVNPKVLKVFQASFKNPEQVTWHEYETYCEVSFTLDKIKTEIQYDDNANVIRTLRYYSQSQLPPYIFIKLQQRFPDRSVFGVTEIYTESDLLYYIKMEDARKWYTIKSDYLGSFEQVETFNKAKV